ncbi:MAG TPA: class I SAM-dependent methyltransferase [bacterium]|nr:class I SAM-dependent methyltransferase [bacterium]HQP98772.1 class I SAM-dependent methyltransferase [bacterium]
MRKNDSKDLWLSIDEKMRPNPIQLGPYTTQAYIQDPIRMSFITSRYKFCARLLTGSKAVLEIGCGDGFGGAMVAGVVEELICTDINERLLADNRERLAVFKNLSFQYHDFRENPFARRMDAIYMIDTIEHLFPEEEPVFMTNVTGSLTDHGVCVIGTPNITADKFANVWSKEGHVNLKSHESLMELGRAYFHNVFFFAMNDEVVHTGFPPMAHFLWVLCVSPKKNGTPA